MSAKKPSPILLRALRLLRDQKPANASAFAQLMWPDSIMHRMVSNQGRGSTRGKAAWLCGGSYLGRLQKAGWVTVVDTWERKHQQPVAYLTRQADDLLAEHPEAKA